MVEKLGVMLCGHGSRDKQAVTEFAVLASHLKERLPQYHVEYGYLEFATPLIRTGLDTHPREQHRQGEVEVCKWPAHAEQMREFTQRINERCGLELTWHAQGIASATLDALKALLLRRRREQLTEAQKAVVVRRQDGRCAACHGICEPDDREFDHKVPLHASQRQGLANYQLLCIGCHHSTCGDVGGLPCGTARTTYRSSASTTTSASAPRRSWAT